MNEIVEDLIFFIPARRGSKGLPFKNRKLFNATISAIPLKFHKNIVVSTDDEVIIEACETLKLNCYKRIDKLSNDTASTTDVLLNFKELFKIKENVDIVLLYLTYPERTWEQIKAALGFYKAKKAKSLLCKKTIKTNPYLCMYGQGDFGIQVIDHDLYRRQDYKKIFEISHYIGIFKASEIQNLNKNLYNDRTVFYKIGDVVDVDTPKDLTKFLNKKHVKSLSKKPNLNYLNNLVKLDSIELKEYFKNKKICLVANSSELLDFEYGDFIDSHDVVIRFNDYKIDKKHTGEKINIHVVFRSFTKDKDLDIDYKVLISGPLPEWREAIKNEDLKDTKYKIIHYNYPNGIDLNTYKCGAIRTPTSGLGIFIMFCKMNLQKNVTLVGFNGYNGGSVDSIYRENAQNYLAAAHSYTAEQKYWKHNFTNVNEISLKTKL